MNFLASPHRPSLLITSREDAERMGIVQPGEILPDELPPELPFGIMKFGPLTRDGKFLSCKSRRVKRSI